MNASRRNVSTENQPKGSACNLSDTLDRQNEQVAGGQRQWADDSAAEPEAMETDVAQNASVRAGGEAAGGIAAQRGIQPARRPQMRDRARTTMNRPQTTSVMTDRAPIASASALKS
jgi:hypothetical protein